MSDRRRNDRFGGFSMGFKKSSGSAGSNRAVPPPPSLTAGTSYSGTSLNSGMNKKGYHSMNAISQNAINATYGIPTSRPKTEEEYFDEDDDVPPSHQSGNAADDSEEDPLDAFMKDLDSKNKSNICQDNSKPKNDSKDKKAAKGVRDDIEEEDDEESYYRYMLENPQAGLQADDSDSEQIEYDEDGNPVRMAKKIIDPLPPVDHSTINYPPFEKNFYEEHSEIKELALDKIVELRQTLGLKVTGVSIPKPVCSFAHFNFDETLMSVIRKSEFTQPTPIQAQAIPAALSGRDLIGIAQTGSGKTAAFLWPLLVHVMDQPSLKPGDGPIGLILAPTRELSLQIYAEAKKFGKAYGINVVCCYGGGSKWEQSKDLEQGAEIVVATPGRMIDMVKMKATNLLRVTFLVLDEADRMFDMGFEPQVRSICNHVRPDRQTMLFSATFKKRIEKLARDVLTDPIRIVQGDVGEASHDVTQIIQMLPQQGNAKWDWLTARLVEFTAAGSVLIFVTKKANAEQLAASLKARETSCELLHGDMDQIERNRVISSFKKQEVPILVATDVAARGLDIPHIKTVINYDMARDIDTHTHRVGRTGRAGEKGTAYTLVTSADKEFAGHLVRNLEGANQPVPEALMNLAIQSAWFRKSRFKDGKGRMPNVGGRGLGFTEKGNTPTANRPYKPPATLIPESVAAAIAANSGGGGGGPGGGRLAALKAAFQSQYKSKFQSGGVGTDSSSSAGPPPPRPVEEPEQQPKKKSRWDK